MGNSNYCYKFQLPIQHIINVIQKADRTKRKNIFVKSAQPPRP